MLWAVGKAGFVQTVGNMTMPSPMIAERIEESAVVDSDSPWKVLVWNDPVNTMDYVVFVFQKIFGYSKDKAVKLMLEVHNDGKSAVASGSREQMETYVFRLHEYALWATLEQD